MFIISKNISLDTHKDVISFGFESDDELSDFIKKLVETPVKSGVRILCLIPPNLKLNPLASALIDVIEGMDGILGKDTEAIQKESVDRLTDIINKYSPNPE